VYAPNIAFFLARLCCFRDRLPQGAATSPQLSNIIFYKSDVRLARLAEAFKLTYTRYADDLAFSGEEVPRALARYVETILSEEGFAIRRDKTRFCTSGNRKILTGLLVSGNKPRVPPSFRRDVARDVYYIGKFGYLSHVTKRKIGDPFYIDRLYGRLIFWKHIEKENKRVDAMIKIVGSVIKQYRERG
jgi:RNA-directed DNA polymerase